MHCIMCALTQLETTRLNEIRFNSTVNHIEVSKIDFDIGILTDVMSELIYIVGDIGLSIIAVAFMEMT